MKPTVYVNGLITDASAAVVPVFDHGFLYGEGVYETMRTFNGRPFMFPRHMTRLRQSAAQLGIEVPCDDDGLRARIIETLAAADDGTAADAYVRLMLTRGVGDLSYSPSACPVPSLIIIVKTLPAMPARWISEGIKVALVGIRRNHPDAVNPMIKSNNLLNNALAMQEALRKGAEEALMCNHDGYVVECAQSNFFIVRSGVVMTAPLSDGLLPGVTRGWVIELAAEIGVPAVEARISPADVAVADEAFITGTTRGITPVVLIDDQRVGFGAPGAVTLRLMQQFQRRAGDFI